MKLPQMVDENNKLILYSIKDYKQMDFMDLRIWCHYHGRYSLVTKELVEYLGNAINGRSVIEVGAGCGDLGYHLGITMTDSFIQEDPEVAAFYYATGQPTIKYGKDVHKFEALAAIKHYKPEVVIGSWVTTWISPTKPPKIKGSIYGLKETQMLKLCKEYIVIGSTEVHHQKPIFKQKHETVIANDIVMSRSDRNDNMIWHWRK